MRVVILLLALSWFCYGADYRAPAGERPARRRPGGESILPGGRLLTPHGKLATTGPGPFGLAVNGKGDMVVTANGGPNRYSFTVMRKEKSFWKTDHIVAAREGEAGEDEDWRSVFMGLAFAGEHEFYASEGNSGRVRLVDARSGKGKWVLELNAGEFKDSYSGDLALDAARGVLYVLDQANFRMVAIDTRTRRILSSLKVGRLPFSIALSPDGKRAYVTNIGMFEYQALPGVNPKRARETGLPFPAFGFPSPEALAGAARPNASGQTIQVPGLGDPNVEQSNSLCVVNLESPAEPRIEKFIRTGRPFGGGIHGGSSPSGVSATTQAIYVSNGHNDSITVIDARTLEVAGEIELRVPGLEKFRGVLPVGSAVHPASGWLLVAEAGINAVGVIDTTSRRLLGHIPSAWFPTRVRLHGDHVYVSCAKGQGTGPNATASGPEPDSFQGERRRGAIQHFPLPGAAELASLTRRVMANNGFLPQRTGPPPLPDAIQYVVIIVKENRTFDEVFGDIDAAANGAVNGAPGLARFGRHGWAANRGSENSQRLGLRDVNVTPNHHEMARRWAFSDNFYADSEVSVDGHHWLVGSYPNAWTESSLMAAYGRRKDFRLPTTAPGRLQFAESNSSLHPEEQLEAGALWHHLERHGIRFRNFGEGFELAGIDEGPGLKPTGGRFLTNVPMPDPLFRNTSRRYPGYNMNIPDQYRATRFIEEVEELYLRTGADLPRLIYIHLPNDHMTRARPQDGYPFEASYVADNDIALGRIVAFLSRTRWWPKMAILVTEDDAQGGVDHVDSHRTVLLVISPYAKRNYVSHAHSSFPGLLKTALRLLKIPPLNLYDASATDLSDCFTTEADFTPYTVQNVRPDLFDPARAKDPLDPLPSPPMDHPEFLRRQHQR